MTDKLYWRLAANSDATIPKGNGCFHWLRHEYPDYAPIYVVKKEDYLSLQSQLTACQDELREAREMIKHYQNMDLNLRLKLGKSDGIISRQETENQQLREQLAESDKNPYLLRLNVIAGIISGEYTRDDLPNFINSVKTDITFKALEVIEQNTALTEKCARLEKAIIWALGYTNFRQREEGEGAYWWRKELRTRSGLSNEECLQALQDTKNADGE